MKKMAIVAALLLLGISARAQHFGVIGGLTTSTTNFSRAYQEVKDGMIAQWHAGVAYNQPLILGLSLQPALEYNVKGARMQGADNVDFKTGFIELPVQVQYGWNVLGILRPYVMLEPFIGVAVFNDQKVSIGSGWKNTWDNVASRFEWGLGLGAGMDLFKHVQVSLRWYWNFGNVYSYTVPEITQKVIQSSPNGLSLSAAVFF